MGTVIGYVFREKYCKRPVYHCGDDQCLNKATCSKEVDATISNIVDADTQQDYRGENTKHSQTIEKFDIIPKTDGSQDNGQKNHLMATDMERKHLEYFQCERDFAVTIAITKDEVKIKRTG